MTRHVKLGLLVIAAVVAVIAIAIALGIHATRGDTVTYHTYFDESVQGLDVGSPVKYRGVPIGTVAAIEIAPDRVHVDVELALRQNAVARLDLGLGSAPPGARAQLANQGLTGVKFVDIDFFDPNESPPPKLAFEAKVHVIPSRRSLLHGLAANLDIVSQKLPDLADRGTAALEKLDKILDEVREAHLGSRAGDALDRTALAVADIRRVLHGIDRAHLPEATARALRDFDAAVARIDRAVAQVEGSSGLIASARRATDSFADLGKSAADDTIDLGRTLRELGDAARAVRELAETIERDPTMLLAGRARGRQP